MFYKVVVSGLADVMLPNDWLFWKVPFPSLHLTFKMHQNTNVNQFDDYNYPVKTPVCLEWGNSALVDNLCFKISSYQYVLINSDLIPLNNNGYCIA